ncbi:hypothetical protein GP2_055_00160 [Gordonia paraffinivorans NBRC 108238]|uniref:Uncharacterized protein n=1 Tax=Gordonia paraffinivorans NBRC 108238 TaxID=1223543 RepID=A0ABQ0IRM8_9ACTN|nr:hypothetical protein [Gordonia paraffinivorans]GAC86133.1 hypothetical protein GP2_055_00160 [Gordonia paraffinivorans NBRC 108238]
MSGERQHESLLDRARRLANLARLRADSLGESQDLKRLDTALTKLQGDLGSLQSAVLVHRTLADAGVPVDRLEKIDAPLAKLKGKVDESGLPSARFVQNRGSDVSELESRIRAADVAAWNGWARSRLNTVPKTLIPLLNVSVRGRVQEKLRRLEMLASSQRLEVPTVLDFVRDLDYIRDELSAVGDSDIDHVLRKFSDGRARLLDLTDDDIRVLRDDQGLSTQIYLVIS